MSQELSAKSGASTASAPMKVTTYDQVSSLLIALLTIVGIAVFVLGVTYLSQNIKFETRVPVPVVPDEGEGGGGGVGAEGGDGRGPELEDPGVSELSAVMEPNISTSLESVTQVVTNFAATEVIEAADIQGFDGEIGDNRKAGPGWGPGDGGGYGGGSGGGIGSGRGKGRGSATPRWERWSVRFTSGSVDIYAKQLDFFGIELAAIGGGSKDVEYASQLSKRPIARRTGPSKDEKRLFMTWTKGALKAFDLQLLKAAGVPMDGKEVIQLYPQKTEDLMAGLESAKLNGKPIKSVKRTVFAVRAAGNGFEMYVADQQFQ
jgi:hypothetical protein